MRELGAHGADRRRLGEELVRLVRQRKLVQVTKDRFALPRAAEKKNLISGRLSMHRDGYGFVTPDSDEVRRQIEGDIFINPHAVAAAMHVCQAAHLQVTKATAHGCRPWSLATHTLVTDAATSSISRSRPNRRTGMEAASSARSHCTIPAKSQSPRKYVHG